MILTRFFRLAVVTVVVVFSAQNAEKANFLIVGSGCVEELKLFSDVVSPTTETSMLPVPLPAPGPLIIAVDLAAAGTFRKAV